MKALNLHAVGDLRYEDVPMPVRQAGEVLLKVHACGICGSDLPRVFTKGTYHFPTIPGHEFAGEIVEADDPSLVGRRAAVFPLLPCRKCEACQVGEYAQCAITTTTWLAAQVLAPFAELHRREGVGTVFFDDSLSYEEAAMCEPAAVALHAIGQASVGIGDTVAVFGAGPIGIMLACGPEPPARSASSWCDIDPTKVEFARKQGFDAVNSRETDPVEYIRTQTGGRGADACIEGAGVAQTWEQALKAVKSFGTVVSMGNPAGDMTLTQKGYWEILRKQLTLKGTWNSSYNDVRNEWRTALAAIASHRIDVRPLISHRFPLSEADKAFGVMRERKEFFNKVMFINR